MKRKKIKMTSLWNPSLGPYDLYDFYCEDCDYKFSIRSNEDTSKYIFYKPTKEDKKYKRHTLVECPKCSKILFTDHYAICDSFAGTGF